MLDLFCCDNRSKYMYTMKNENRARMHIIFYIAGFSVVVFHL